MVDADTFCTLYSISCIINNLEAPQISFNSLTAKPLPLTSKLSGVRQSKIYHGSVLGVHGLEYSQRLHSDLTSFAFKHEHTL